MPSSLPITAVSSKSRSLAGVLDVVIFYGLLLVLMLTAIPYGTVEPWSQASFEAAVFGCGLLWVIHGYIQGTWAPKNLSLFWPLIGLIAFAIVQSLSWSTSEVAGNRVVNAISADPFESWLFALRLSALTLAGILIARFMNDATRLGILIHTLILVASASAVFGIARQALQHGQGFLLPALPYGGGFAQFINKNHFAFLAEAGIGLILGIALVRNRWRERLLVYGAAMILLWVALIMSRSRGGLLAASAQMVFAALMFMSLRWSRSHDTHVRMRPVRVIGLTAAAAIVLLALIVGGVIWLGGDQLTTGVETAAVEMGADRSGTHEGSRRIDIWGATWRMARAHPLLGAGLGGYWAEIPKYHDASGAQTPQQAHNDYLELVASGGIVGVVIFVWFAVALARQSRRAFQNMKGTQRAATIGAMIGIVGIAAHSLLDFGLHITANALVFVMLLSILSLDRFDQRLPAQAHRTAAFN